MILNKAQAIAVYDAMCALNNVGGKIKVFIPAYDVLACIQISEEISGYIKIVGFTKIEEYTNQNGFATAYGLN